MRCAALSGITAIALLLAGCQNEPEETPDIIEAIPRDPEPEDTDQSDGLDTSDEGAGEPQAGSAEPGDAPSVPDTMESGSNPPGMTAPPPGSKLQPADG